MSTYTINTTNFAISEYKGSQFNSCISIAAIDDELFMHTPTKLYHNTGSYDHSNGISAYIVTGYINFNDSGLKRILSKGINISYDSDNSAELTIYVSTDGVEDTDYYTVTIDSAYPEVFRPVIWDGLKARYWKFKLQNTDGSDFSLEDWYVNLYSTGREIK